MELPKAESQDAPRKRGNWSRLPTLLHSKLQLCSEGLPLGRVGLFFAGHAASRSRSDRPRPASGALAVADSSRLHLDCSREAARHSSDRQSDGTDRVSAEVRARLPLQPVSVGAAAAGMPYALGGAAVRRGSCVRGVPPTPMREAGPTTGGHPVSDASSARAKNSSPRSTSSASTANL